MSHACLNRSAASDDDGLVDPRLAGAHTPAAKLSVLGSVRLFVPVVPVVTEGESVTASTGGDKDADMATVLMTGNDGRTALLCFSSMTAMAAWNPNARPVGVSGFEAAQVATSDGASAMLLDIGSPGFTVIETEDLGHLAAGDQLVDTPAGVAWVVGL